MSRELRHNAASRGGKLEYRASVAQWKAELTTQRPKTAKLAVNERLREYVQERLSGKVRRPNGTPVPGPETAPGKGRNKPPFMSTNMPLDQAGCSIGTRRVVDHPGVRPCPARQRRVDGGRRRGEGDPRTRRCGGRPRDHRSLNSSLRRTGHDEERDLWWIACAEQDDREPGVPSREESVITRTITVCTRPGCRSSGRRRRAKCGGRGGGSSLRRRQEDSTSSGSLVPQAEEPSADR